MDLTTWMKANGENDQSVGDKIGVTRSYVFRVRLGQVSPSLVIALAIHGFTNGEVELEQLLPRHLRPGVKPSPARASKSDAKPDSVRKLPAPRASKARASV